MMVIINSFKKSVFINTSFALKSKRKPNGAMKTLKILTGYLNSARVSEDPVIIRDAAPGLKYCFRCQTGSVLAAAEAPRCQGARPGDERARQRSPVHAGWGRTGRVNELATRGLRGEVLPLTSLACSRNRMVLAAFSTCQITA